MLMCENEQNPKLESCCENGKLRSWTCTH